MDGNTGEIRDDVPVQHIGCLQGFFIAHQSVRGKGLHR